MLNSISVLIGIILLTSGYKAIVAAENNVARLAEKQGHDEAIKNILFRDASNIHSCLNISTRLKRNNTKLEKPLWTVVILKEIRLGGHVLNVQQCTGSIIHPQVVLTAAHCIFDKTLGELKVRAGECERQRYHNSTTIQERSIESVVLQKTYNPIQPRKDAALVFLKERFHMTPNVKTVCLPPPRFRLDTGYVQCFVGGWELKVPLVEGHVRFNKINQTIIPHDKCEEFLRLTGVGKEFRLHKSFLCTIDQTGKNMLSNNGGAPLVCPICETGGRVVQIGIMSWGFNTTALPEVFTSTSSIRQWMLDQLKIKKIKLPYCGLRRRQL